MTGLVRCRVEMRELTGSGMTACSGSPAKASGRLSSGANQTGGCEPSGSYLFSEKLSAPERDYWIECRIPDDWLSAAEGLSGTAGAWQRGEPGCRLLQVAAAIPSLDSLVLRRSVLTLKS